MAELVLSKGKIAVIDDDDFKRASHHSWHYRLCHGGKEYASARIDGKLVQLHRFLLNETDTSKDIDHINGGTLDNRKCNLRSCTRTENICNAAIYASNTSGYKGVHFNKRDQKYQANIRINKKLKFLGYFKTASEAALAYNNAAVEAFGKFANINKLEKI